MSRNSLVVLSEEEYVRRLGNIIKRDFFPDTIEYRIKLKKNKSDRDPQGGDDQDAGLGVDAFQRRYTTEDDASFEKLQEKAVANIKSKYAWAFDNPQNASKFLLIGNTNKSSSSGSGVVPAIVDIKQNSKRRKRKRDVYMDGKQIVTANTRFEEMPYLSDDDPDDGKTETSSAYQPPSVKGYTFVVPAKSERDKLAYRLGKEAERSMEKKKRKSHKTTLHHHGRPKLSKDAQNLAKKLLHNSL